MRKLGIVHRNSQSSCDEITYRRKKHETHVPQFSPLAFDLLAYTETLNAEPSDYLYTSSYWTDNERALAQNSE